MTDTDEVRGVCEGDDETGTLDLGGGGGAEGLGGGGGDADLAGLGGGGGDADLAGLGGGVVLEGVVLENEPLPADVPPDLVPVVLENEEVVEGLTDGLSVVLPDERFGVEADVPEPLAAELDATVLVGIPSEILLHPTKASDDTLSAVGRLSGERYLHPAKARGPILASLPST